MDRATPDQALDLMRLGRRTLLGTAAAGVVAGRPARAQAPRTITMAVWANEAEDGAFRAAIAKYTALHPDVSIKLEVGGTGPQYYQQMDTRLAGRQAPDIFRVQYQQVGRYASSRALVDLGKYLDVGDTADIAPAFMQAVTFKGRPYAMPHHTDTFALYYNRDMMQKAGITPPTSLDQSWSWPDFIRVAQQLKAGGAPFGFAMSWQNGTAYRWLPFLYQHGGQLLSDDLGKSQLSTPAGIETIAWTQSWFRDKLVPPSTSIKSSEQSQNLFANGTVGMLMGGNWQIPFLTKNMAAPWGVTYMPRDLAMASDLGGNCLAVTRDSKAPELAADVVRFMADKANMQDFVVGAQFLPVRRSLMSGRLPYALRPEAMQVFVEQATTIPPHLVSTVTLPFSSKINAALTDNLDLAFTAGRDPAETAKAIDAQVQALLPA